MTSASESGAGSAGEGAAQLDDGGDAAWRTGQLHHPLAQPPHDAPWDVVFLDRDGTLNQHAPGYRTGDDLVMLAGAADAVRRLNARGIPVVLVTNQRGLATGALTWAEFDAAQQVVMAALDAIGAHLDDVRVCPHAIGVCTCRKPLPGLLDAVFAENPWMCRDRAVFIGDAGSDAEAASAAGVAFIRVSPTQGLSAGIDEVTRAYAPEAP